MWTKYYFIGIKTLKVYCRKLPWHFLVFLTFLFLQCETSENRHELILYGSDYIINNPLCLWCVSQGRSSETTWISWNTLNVSPPWLVGCHQSSILQTWVGCREFLIMEDINRSSSQQQCVTWTLSMVLISFSSLCPLSSSPLLLLSSSSPPPLLLLFNEWCSASFVSSDDTRVCGLSPLLSHLGPVEPLWEDWRCEPSQQVSDNTRRRSRCLADSSPPTSSRFASQSTDMNLCLVNKFKERMKTWELEIYFFIGIQ